MGVADRVSLRLDVRVEPRDMIAVLSNPSAVAALRAILDQLPDEEARKTVLKIVLESRCPSCLDYSPTGSFWCCYDSRGD